MKNRLLSMSMAATFLPTMLLVLPAQAVEFSLDTGWSGASVSDSWGAGLHAQWVSNEGLGVDVGYEHLNNLNYEIDGTTINHPLTQYELSALWQFGGEPFQAQVLAGGLFSGTGVASGTSSVIDQFSSGYQLGVGVSVPVFGQLRAFGEVGYEGWFRSEIPNHLTWRYGVRWVFGGRSPELPENEARALERQQALLAQTLDQDPTTTIDPAVPEYVPNGVSQSLAPIISGAELCKCFPAGPYTLQLGEFGNMDQALRGLEYRGLRQFFNSRAYQRSPLPVFLAQPEGANDVALFIGELTNLEQLEYWRYELRKNGISARLQRVENANGQRVQNPMVEVDDSQLASTPRFSAEDIRRMNSLPGDEPEIMAPVNENTLSQSQMAALEQYNAQQAIRQAQENAMPDSASTIETKFQLGPISRDRLSALLASEAMQKVLAGDPSIDIPKAMSLLWDEGQQQAWLNFHGFGDTAHLSEWQAWFESEGLTGERVGQYYQPLGDVYRFHLGRGVAPYSVEVYRANDANQMLAQMRSPEVLWFQAFHRINNDDISLTLNWSFTDNRYHLVVVNVPDGPTQQEIWANLTAVGLLPSLAEQ